jgi:hypothetical protein
MLPDGAIVAAKLEVRSSDADSQSEAEQVNGREHSSDLTAFKLICNRER